jgi:hypothetical protein
VLAIPDFLLKDLSGDSSEFLSIEWDYRRDYD